MPVLQNVLALLSDIADEVALFPLWAVVDGKCSCGQSSCEKGGKHPACWWAEVGIAEKRTTQFNGHEPISYGIATGSRSGNIFVLDCDVRPKKGVDGVAVLTQLFAARGGMPLTRVHATPTGGRHYYFRAPEGFVVPTLGTAEKTRFALGVDVRGEKGGFVVAPGCPHRVGGTYAVERADPVAPAPQWLLEELAMRAALMRDHSGHEDIASSVVPIPLDSELGGYIVDAAIELCETAEPSIDGGGGSVAALKVASRLVRKWRMPPEDALRVMLEIYNPRCAPPWSEAELVHKIESALSNPAFIHEEYPEAYEEMIEARRRAKQIAAVPVRSVRRQHDPQHTYKFIAGVTTSGMSNDPEAALPVDVAKMLASHPDWDGRLQFDTFRQRIIAVDPPMQMHAENGKLSDRDIAHIRMWLSCHGVLLKKEDANDCVLAAAERVSFDPVLERIEACRDARVPGILDTMAAEVFGATEPLAQDFLKKTLVAAVRRAKVPGTRVDTVLVLVGEQGARKTTFVQELFGVDLVRSQMPDLDNKDASIGLQDFWVVELGEIHKILKADKDTVKEFLSRAYDDFIPRYGRNDVRMPRHTIFIGTTNEERFLSDATGNRRYWPVFVNKVDLAWVRRNLAAIWGEALYLAELPTSLEGGDETFDHWFPNEAMVTPAHEAFITTDPWHESVRSFIEGRQKVKPSDVFVDALGGKIVDFDRSKQMRVADTLKRLGCRQVKSHGKMIYQVPPALADVVRASTGAERLQDRP